MAARTLRKGMTPAERTLWQALRRRRVAGLKFRRQHPIGSFVLDFVCPSIRLVIEVDGPVHDESVDYDQARTDQLERYGYRVIRFTNEEITTQIDGVIRRIEAAALLDPDLPPPELGEG